MDMFQSTRPMRGATFHFMFSFYVSRVSIHAPHAGRDYDDLSGFCCIDVSIHAPHAGRDSSSQSRYNREACFNPRAPCGARRRRRYSQGVD